jgi:dihydroxy-acid dehydratase
MPKAGLKIWRCDWWSHPTINPLKITIVLPHGLTEQHHLPKTMAPGMDLNRFSAQITVPKSQGNAQAMLYATGIKDEAQMQLPQVGISSIWWEGNPCTTLLS